MRKRLIPLRLVFGLVLINVVAAGLFGFACLFPVLRSRNSSTDEGCKMSIKSPPITFDRAKTTFTKDTGIPWPDAARDVSFDERRVGMLGDGQLYVTFTLPRKSLEAWLRASPPWGGKRWLPGPVPPDVGRHCGFSHENPLGCVTNKDGSKNYTGGTPEILAILTSKSAVYATRDRSPADCSNPWYNGDILIVDPKTGVVRYCSWDM